MKKIMTSLLEFLFHNPVNKHNIFMIVIIIHLFYGIVK